jgi:hypothetical protein
MSLKDLSGPHSPTYINLWSSRFYPPKPCCTLPAKLLRTSPTPVALCFRSRPTASAIRILCTCSAAVTACLALWIHSSVHVAGCKIYLCSRLEAVSINKRWVVSILYLAGLLAEL